MFKRFFPDELRMSCSVSVTVAVHRDLKLQALLKMVFEYTTPRGPVAAMFSGPGPSYGLPGLTGRSNHDPSSRFVKAPAYHFTSRSLNEQMTAGPGPCYMPPPKV